MRLLYTNWVDSATITASSEVSTLPASNVANEQRQRRWRTGATLTDEWVKFDLGSARAIGACVICEQDLNGDSDMYIEGNATDSWGSPSYSLNIPVTAGTLLAVFASTQTFRWWRLKWVKNTAADQRNIGRIYLGPVVTIGAPSWDGVEIEQQDLSVVSKTIGGQAYADVRTRYDLVACDFRAISQTDVDAVRTLFEAVGMATSFFLQVDTASPFNECYYGRLTSRPSPRIATFDTAFRYDLSLEFEEAV